MRQKTALPRVQMFASGARVVVRDEEWVVRSSAPTSTGGVAVRVTGLSELVRGKESIFLTDFDTTEELRPEETKLVHDPSPKFRRAKLYLESLLRRSPPSDGRLYIGHRAAMNPAPYQHVPAAMALDQPRPRILIADGVGLGKTLEVGILLSELIRRGRGDRILVVALKSILSQFQEELWARFTIPLVRLDSRGIQRVQAQIPSNMNPFYFFNRVIISIDTLKKDTKYRRYLEHCHWDAIVIDECQHVAVRARPGSTRTSQRARLANLLARTCDALILTSATPHDGRPESFASLVNLLDPTAIADPTDYTKDDIDGLYVRRFKKDVAHESGDSFSERELRSEHCEANPCEDAALAAVRSATFQTIDRKRKNASSRGILFRTHLLKALLSSPAACHADLEKRLRHKALEDTTDPAVQHDRQELTRLLRRVEAITPKKNSKLTRLVRVLRELGWGGPSAGDRVVIFSERIPTLHFLRDHLRKELKLSAEAIRVFHGSLTDTEQQSLVKDFGTERGKTRLLLAGDAASEGINLHFFCHQMVHFDIPWSLITLEQRNGRIDRFGQKHTPEMRYLLTRPTDPGAKGDLRILERLIEKEDAAHKNLGDVAWLMQLHDPEKEEERIARGIEAGEAPESIIPDEPAPTGFLDLLLGGGAPAGADPGTEPAWPARAETAEPLSLYPDDLSYAREAFAAIQEVDPSLEPPEWHDHLGGFVLHMPEDLRLRYRYLPPELRTREHEARLTVDRERVTDALEVSRQEENRWPEWQLFWELHPIAEWLNDRVLSAFLRNEAPVIRVPRGLQADEAAILFQGVLSNRRGQPVIVSWFAVIVRETDEGTMTAPLEDLLAETGLDAQLANPGKEVDVEWVSDRLPTIVDTARQYMALLRQDRQRALMPKLQAGQRRVKSWKRGALARLDAREARYRHSNQGALRSDLQKKLERGREDIEKRVAKRNEWIDLGLRTIEEPYLRVTAVLVT